MIIRKIKNRESKIKSFLFIILIIILLGYWFILRPINEVKNKSIDLVKEAKQLKTTFSKNDISLLKKDLNRFKEGYEDFQLSAEKLYWLSFIPYTRDFKNIVNAGEYLIKAGNEAVEVIEPYADLIGFKKGESSFVEKSAEERIQTAVLTLDKIVNKVDPISEDIKKANDLIKDINPNLYPKKIGRTEIREKVILLKEQIQSVNSLFVDAKPLIKKLPEILGVDEEKTYLILYQNDKERRATGGFLTFYSIVKVKNGKIKIVFSDDIYSLDKSISYHPKAPREILSYHKNVYSFYIRDSNLSPDFKESIKLFNTLYEKSSLKVNYDGIIAMDSKILVDVLDIFGDTNVNGITFSSKIDKRCDCPQVIYTLFDIVDRPVGYLKENRKGILGDLMETLFYKALGYSPSKYWGKLIQTMYKNLEEKHILLYFVDEKIQKAIEQVNFAGRINRDNGNNYLHINNVNFAGAKANLFVSETVNLEINNKKVILKISYKNPYPHSDCNLERGGLCLNATLRNWLRVYVPLNSVLNNFKGSSKKVKTYNELGKTVFEGFLEVPTQGKAEILIDYSLPENLKTDYLLIQKQPGVVNQRWKVIFDNKVIYEGYLDKDQLIKIK